ncbi:retron Ec48 family effector membrane protein [Salinicola halophyticus]|uniref:retron Ec48 family effector membrane protein n=1 Tax=Salinicola halophyticus TaxID=1808881 RepID=UPI003F487F7A
MLWLSKEETDFYFTNRVCLAVGVVGLISALTIFFCTGFNENAFEKSICFSNDCIVEFSRTFQSALIVLKGSGAIIIGVLTLGSFRVASKSYLSNKNAYNANSHIAHLNVFMSYLNNEVAKKDKLNITTFDPLKWYNSIYPHSKHGKLEASNDYLSKLKSLQEELDKSSNYFSQPSPKIFQHNDHQDRIMAALAPIGIKLNRLPPLDFYSVEDQAFSVIDNINHSFCHIDSDTKILRDRAYK